MADTDYRDRFVELARWLASWTWPIEESASKALAESRGWTLLDDDPGRGATWDTGLAARKAWASFRIDDGLLDDVGLTTDLREQDDPEAEKATADAFADQVDAVTEVLGRPRRTGAGREGSAIWDLPNKAMLNVGRTTRSCSWEFTSPAYAEVQRQLGDRASVDEN